MEMQEKHSPQGAVQLSVIFFTDGRLAQNILLGPKHNQQITPASMQRITIPSKTPASHAHSFAVLNIRVRNAMPSAISNPVAIGTRQVPALTRLAVSEGQILNIFIILYFDE